MDASVAASRPYRDAEELRGARRVARREWDALRFATASMARLRELPLQEEQTRAPRKEASAAPVSSKPVELLRATAGAGPTESAQVAARQVPDARARRWFATAGVAARWDPWPTAVAAVTACCATALLLRRSASRHSQRVPAALRQPAAVSSWPLGALAPQRPQSPVAFLQPVPVPRRQPPFPRAPAPRRPRHRGRVSAPVPPSTHRSNWSASFFR